ncbi:MAG: endonuclease domain-containing protein [Patescibacteria group bacterium]
MNPIVTDAKQFTFRSYTFDRATGAVTLTYAIADEEFVERVVFPIPSTGIPEGIDEALDRALFAMHLIAGVSYYKAKLPPEIVVESGSLTNDQAEFWNKLYTLGLGEFFYRNELDFRGYVKFPVTETPSSSPLVRGRDSGSGDVPPPYQGGARGGLVPIGGGKDSLVAIEMLDAANIPFDLVMFGNHARIRDVASEVGKPLLSIARTIDPKLIELNKAGAWNGHVPITAYVGIASVITAMLHGRKDVIFANERSANSGNAEFEGVMINHQYSKSLEAERDLQSYLASFVSPDIRLFSVLRPLSELDIARRFAQNGKYFGVFSSCNKNYKQGGVPSVTRWCGKCPKCAFVFVMLGAFIPRRRMVEMFGEDLLMRDDLLSMYKDLTGYGAMKPFECVGEFEEVIAAFALIHGRGEYDDSPIMRWFVNDVMNTRRDIDALIDRVLAVSSEHAMPEEYAQLVYASR